MVRIKSLDNLDLSNMADDRGSFLIFESVFDYIFTEVLTLTMVRLFFNKYKTLLRRVLQVFVPNYDVFTCDVLFKWS